MSLSLVCKHTSSTISKQRRGLTLTKKKSIICQQQKFFNPHIYASGKSQILSPKKALKVTMKQCRVNENKILKENIKSFNHQQKQYCFNHIHKKPEIKLIQNSISQIQNITQKKLLNQTRSSDIYQTRSMFSKNSRSTHSICFKHKPSLDISNDCFEDVSILENIKVVIKNPLQRQQRRVNINKTKHKKYFY